MSKVIRIRLIAALVVMTILLAIFAGCNRHDPADDVELFWPDGMSSELYSSKEEPDEAAGITPLTAPQSFLAQVADFKSKNPDAVGWLCIPGTEINEVIVQDEGGNEKYHRANALGESDFNGCLYADYEARVSGSADQISQNIVIYGHSMTDTPDSAQDEKKFTQLKKLLDKDFAETHPYIYFSNENQDFVYEIFSVMYANSDDFNYIDCNFAETEFDDLVNTAKAGSLFEYPELPVNGDRLISLSTCTYKFGDTSSNQKQRFVVFGRLLTDQDDMPDSIVLQENPSPMMPTFS